MKKILTIFSAVLLTIVANAANPDQFHKLSDATLTDSVYLWPLSSSDIKAQNCTTSVEVPEKSSGKIAFYCASASSDRFLYPIVNGSTDNTRPIAKLNKQFSEIEYTSSDIVTANGTTCLQFTSPDDYKYRQIKLTVYSSSGSTGTTTKTDDATLSDLKVDGNTITGFSSSTESYNYTVPATQTVAPKVEATAKSEKAKIDIQQPGLPASGSSTTATIKVTAEDGTTTKTYTITFTRGALSNNANLKELKYNNTSVPSFNPNTTEYKVELPYGTTAVPVVTATPEYPGAKVAITQATSVTGKAEILVTAEDQQASKAYTITFSVAEKPNNNVPSTTLGVHKPGIYTDDVEDDGYGATLINGYEVYYCARYKKDGKNNVPIICTGDVKDDAKGNPETIITKDETTRSVNGEWIKANFNTDVSQSKTQNQGEFNAACGIWKFTNDATIEMHISGYSELSILAKDNKADASKNLRFEIYVDDVAQPTNQTKNEITIRRYPINTGEHVIRIVGLGGSNNEFYAFSLKPATPPQPRIKFLEGNDSTQSIFQTHEINPITYFVKFNEEVKLEWDNSAATGIVLAKIGKTTAKGDTVQITGPANCPVGTYNYRLVAYQGGAKADEMQGKFTVKSMIEAKSDTIVEAYVGEDMDDIVFRYYALSENDITLTWIGGTTPAGITGSGKDGKYYIGGKPTTAGIYKFSITVKGGNTITGQIEVKKSDLGNNPILYLYSNTYNSGIYKYLTSKGHNLVPRKQKSTMRDDYSMYKMVIISENAEADNEEVLGVIKGNANTPVLNMQNFAYTPSRLDWGAPDNGSLSNHSITVIRNDHPIFKAMGSKKGDKIELIKQPDGSKSLMPIKVTYEGTICLATAVTRGRGYDEDGDDQTFLHEIPADKRNGKKYLLLPIATEATENLTADGKRLVDACMKYLLGTEAGVAAPTLEIKDFRLKDVVGTIDKGKFSITAQIDENEDITKQVPTIVLADPNSHVTPCSGDTVDFSDDFFGVDFVVSDYINTVTYNVIVRNKDLVSIHNIYAPGQWVDIYDIRGTKVMTTNENVHQVSLPLGMYIVVSPSGTFKIIR